MRLREPFVKRHVHIWMRKSIKATMDPYFYVGGNEFDIVRECNDCGVKQTARITTEDRNSLPESLMHLGDWGWM